MKFCCANCGGNLEINDRQIIDNYKEIFNVKQDPILPKRGSTIKTNLSIGLMGSIKYQLRLNGWTIRTVPVFNGYTEKITNFNCQTYCKNCWVGKFDNDPQEHL